MARTATQRRKKKKRNRFKTVVILFCINLVLMLLLAGGIVFVCNQEGQAFSWLTIQDITLEGNTRYDPAAIIGESGLSIGQNVFAINKATAAKNIRERFPYIADAKVESPTYNTIKITITEVSPIGAMYAAGNWLVVGENGNILETLPLQSDRPGRYFYLQGATPTGEITPGNIAMDERSIGIVKTLTKAFADSGVSGVLGIDLRDKTNISFNWKNKLTVVLGNESNLAAEVDLFQKSLPHILERNGGSLEGRLDMSSYSDNIDANDKIIYTPKDIA